MRGVASYNFKRTRKFLVQESFKLQQSLMSGSRYLYEKSATEMGFSSSLENVPTIAVSSASFFVHYKENPIKNGQMNVEQKT